MRVFYGHLFLVVKNLTKYILCAIITKVVIRRSKKMINCFLSDQIELERKRKYYSKKPRTCPNCNKKAMLNAFTELCNECSDKWIKDLYAYCEQLEKENKIQEEKRKFKHEKKIKLLEYIKKIVQERLILTNTFKTYILNKINDRIKKESNA